MPLNSDWCCYDSCFIFEIYKLKCFKFLVNNSLRTIEQVKGIVVDSNIYKCKFWDAAYFYIQVKKIYVLQNSFLHIRCSKFGARLNQSSVLHLLCFTIWDYRMVKHITIFWRFMDFKTPKHGQCFTIFLSSCCSTELWFNLASIFGQYIPMAFSF